MRTSLVAALFACFLVVPLAAQDRMPPIATDRLTDAQKKAADEFSQGRGYAVRGPFVPLIRSPEVMLRAKAMGRRNASFTSGWRRGRNGQAGNSNGRSTARCSSGSSYRRQNSQHR
jgi:hypothetical protein